MQIERALQQNKIQTMPQVYLRPDLDKSLTAKLKDIVKRHQGAVVDSSSEATHIVHPIPPKADQSQGLALQLTHFISL